MSVIRETCGCGAVWEGNSAYRGELVQFREAHAPCREIDRRIQEDEDRRLEAEEQVEDASRNTREGRMIYPLEDDG